MLVSLFAHQPAVPWDGALNAQAGQSAISTHFHLDSLVGLVYVRYTGYSVSAGVSRREGALLDSAGGCALRDPQGLRLGKTFRVEGRRGDVRDHGEARPD